MRRRTRAHLAIVGIATMTLASVIGVGPAPAQDAAEADKLKLLEGMGRRAFQERRWDDAIDAFEAAFLMRQDPRYQYNIGRCHEKAGRIDKAAECLTEYVSRDIDPKDRSDAEAVLAVLKVKQQRAEAGGEPQPAEGALEVQEHEEVAPPPPAPAPAAGGRLLDIGWPAVAAVGAGVAMLGGGVTFGLMSSAAEVRRDDLKGVGPVPASHFVEEDDAARGRALVANVLLGAGVVAVATGVVLFLLAEDEDEDGAVAGLCVEPGPMGVSIRWNGGLR